MRKITNCQLITTETKAVALEYQLSQNKRWATSFKQPLVFFTLTLNTEWQFRAALYIVDEKMYEAMRMGKKS